MKLGHSCLFQQDNDPKNISKLVLEWIKKANITRLEQHSQSPNLSAIKNLWTRLKSQIFACLCFRENSCPR